MRAWQRGSICQSLIFPELFHPNHYFVHELPYISKYIKDKSGKTFGEHVAHIRMKRAKTLLKNGNMTVENIADVVGYPSVEHFNRTFKKCFDRTPLQYRNESREKK